MELNDVIYIKTNKKIRGKVGVSEIGRSRLDGKRVYKVHLIFVAQDFRPLDKQFGIKDMALVRELENELPELLTIE